MTITDIKRANKAAGQHWFSKNTMSFFKTKIESSVMGGTYFITSERMSNNHPKCFTIRQALPDGHIKTVGDFQGFDTLQDAQEALSELLFEQQS